MQLLLNAWYIFIKDLQQEFKTRYVINAILLFSVVTLTAVSFSIGVYTAGKEILSALLWIILFFSAMSGLSHIFVREEETHTSDTLKLVADPISVFLGKYIFNFILLILMEIITVPLFFAVMNFSVENAAVFIVILLIGSIGLSAGATIIAAIISKASAKGALFTVLSFPIILPVLITGISATKTICFKSSFASVSGELQALFAYSVVLITASIMLFEFVWNE
ncbi:MAG: heme exporter protein CcmB [Calditrichia bacterium]|nr:heme exporter protein CcmB [Calditrichia bacterium]